MEPDEYFDDDDLINDYLEESFEDHPPQDDEEDFMEEFIMEQHHGVKQQPSTTPATPPAATNPPVTTRATTPQLLKQTETVPVAEINVQSMPSRKKDIFSFERYNRSDNWRNQKNGDAFEVKEWKRTKAVTPNKPKRSNIGPLLESKPALMSVQIDLKRSGVSRMPREGRSSITMTVAGGTRLHVANNCLPVELKKSPNKRENNAHLLGVSMTTLMARSDTMMLKQDQYQRKPSSYHSGDTQLWVDKHAPRTFSHLLSDEQTNRNVLRALRSWDPYVFGRDAPKARYIPKDNATSTTTTPINPRDVRPEVSKRVLLLSGPPGVGKTTLAHIVARHAGYQPMEVNASDDRSSSILQEKVLRAMESSTLTSDLQLGGKPNCIILDEVDGADAKSAIAALVNIIRAEMPEKGKQTTFLRRPIIFICNHKYAPALRPLLPFCQHFDVEPPEDQRLVSRLRAILTVEKLATPSSYLNQLVVGSGGDIRSSLYTLQFAAAKARAKRTRQGIVVDISKALKSALGGDGLKDARTDLGSTVAAVFKKPKKQKDETSTHKVLSAMESFGESEKTLECLFTNVLQVSYVDPTMERCSLAHEWLSSGMDRASCMPFVAAGAIHLLCAVETRTELTLSNRESSNAYYQLESNRGILKKFVEGLQQSSYINAITETVPYSLWMLSATSALSRPVSSVDILTKKELVAFDAHVSCLRSLGLTYVPVERLSNSRMGHNDDYAAIEMRLEPEIHHLVYFQGYLAAPMNRRKKVPSVLRELLAQKARVEAIREREQMSLLVKTLENSKKSAEVSVENPKSPTASKMFGDSKKKQRAAPESTSEPLVKKAKTNYAPTNFLGVGAMKVKAARTARSKALLGFNNSKSKAEKLSHTGSGLLLKEVIRFKYQKGFTQAVRTPCRLEDMV